MLSGLMTEDWILKSLTVVGIVVDAKADSAPAFYRRFGFIALPGKSDRLLLPNAAYF
ncbi:MAG: hypothetical protein QX191_01975 [Methylococcaceae bacterium]